MSRSIVQMIFSLVEYLHCLEILDQFDDQRKFVHVRLIMLDVRNGKNTWWKYSGENDGGWTLLKTKWISVSRNPILFHPIKVFFLLPWLRRLAYVLCAVEIHFRRFVVEGEYSAKCNSWQSSCKKPFGITSHMVCTNCRTLSKGCFRSPQWLMIFFASPSFVNIEVKNVVRKQMTSFTYRINVASRDQ